MNKEIFRSFEVLTPLILMLVFIISFNSGGPSLYAAVFYYLLVFAITILNYFKFKKINGIKGTSILIISFFLFLFLAILILSLFDCPQGMCEIGYFFNAFFFYIIPTGIILLIYIIKNLFHHFKSSNKFK